MLNPFLSFLSGKDIWRVRVYYWKECVCCRVLWNPPKTACEMHSVFSFCFVIQLKHLTCRKLHIKVSKCLHLTKGESRCSVTFMFQLKHTSMIQHLISKGWHSGSRSDLRENSCGASSLQWTTGEQNLLAFTDTSKHWAWTNLRTIGSLCFGCHVERISSKTHKNPIRLYTDTDHLS